MPCLASAELCERCKEVDNNAFSVLLTFLWILLVIFWFKRKNKTGDESRIFCLKLILYLFENKHGDGFTIYMLLR